MTEAEEIFDAGRSGEWLVYDVETDDDGRRCVAMGSYWYVAEEDEYADEGRGSRHVYEDATFGLDDLIGMYKRGEDPQLTDAYMNRRCDYIEDLAYCDARKGFAEAFDRLPHLDMYSIGKDIYDGQYIGRYRRSVDECRR